MRRFIVALGSLGLVMLGGVATAQGTECDDAAGECGSPDKSGGGGGGGGGAILVDRTDRGDSYQNSDDYDNDGISDKNDNCPRTKNIGQSDGDGDSVGNSCDNCLNTGNTKQVDIDGNGKGNACDSDIDGDGVVNAKDTCTEIPNPPINGSQPDQDGNNVGDACDDDIDGDGVTNLQDPCPASAKIKNPKNTQPGSTCFPDKDGDSIPDTKDVCMRVYDPKQTDMDGNGRGDRCDPDVDGDGAFNVDDNCAMAANPAQTDGDRDQVGNACDDNFCYVVAGSKSNCLDPGGPLEVYSPETLGNTGEPVQLRLFANRRNQPMEYHWRLKSAPEGSQVVLKNRKGTVSVSTPFEYQYVKGDVPTFNPDKPGKYKFQVTVEPVFEDRVSGKTNEKATHTVPVKVKGEPKTKTSGGCGASVASTDRPVSAAFWLLAFGLGGLLIRRRRK